MSTPPGGQRTLQKRRQAQSAKDKQSKATPSNEGSSIFKIYSEEANGLRVDPLVVLFLAVGFIFSVVALHVIAKVTSKAF
ncbi:hypothetical protein Kpol_530p15 [Vanderwaltozyma polyspora DSM 70294]|uniref:Protein transport protein Sec61 subunit beta n=1 Tax=Vanderwaltozyma polyspora (strain ATCC 22028 / DSM 70294 / BCRC 21397 / CBS 2163 / NBRC 10782 / NRRL Y-8283 / UCD 57-17) TaxID=436907 RepID=A7TKY9_VANPO|nr:uncharacterized protein Kpol_530p15 [Vanderwaltozyma polyspora DSM 70294]EDO17045.1 hypothetical protein Kpol_530p15 [Vanderwaltozyma polyspora DSM 70294]